MRRVLLGVVVLVYAWLTFAQATRYQDERLLWQQATVHTPTFRAWINYRNALLSDGDFEGALDTCAALSRLAHKPWEYQMLHRACFGLPD